MRAAHPEGGGEVSNNNVLQFGMAEDEPVDVGMQWWLWRWIHQGLRRSTELHPNCRRRWTSTVNVQASVDLRPAHQQPITDAFDNSGAQSMNAWPDLQRGSVFKDDSLIDTPYPGRR